jgi:hypothetical protein
LEVRINVVNDYVGVRATISEAVHRGPAQLGVWPRHHCSGHCDLPLVERYSAVWFFEVDIGKDGILFEHEDAFDDTSEARRTFKVADLSNGLSIVAYFRRTYFLHSI